MEDDKVVVSKEIMEKVGKLVTLCRSITGGYDLNGCSVQPANVENIGKRVEALRRCLDEYDNMILDMHQERQKIALEILEKE